MKPDSLVGGGDDVSALAPPRLDHPVDCTRVEVGPVGEYDDRRLGFRGQRGKPAAQRRSRALLPLGTANAVRVELVRPGHDDDPVDHGRPHGVEHTRQELHLLRWGRAVAGRRPGGEHDGPDHQAQPASAAQRRWTFATYVSVSSVGARPSFVTTVGPAL